MKKIKIIVSRESDLLQNQVNGEIDALESLGFEIINVQFSDSDKSKYSVMIYYKKD